MLEPIAQHAKYLLCNVSGEQGASSRRLRF